MTLHVSSDCAGVSASGYTGRDLAEYGESAKTIWSERYKSASNLYWKLDEKELYYIRLSGGSSEKICSTMISLLPPDEIEDNDAWYRATPLYEDVVQAFDLSAPNDTEWFRFTVPTGSQKVLLLDITKTDTGDDVHDSAYADFNLYREVYFNGQDDSSLYRFRLDNTYWPTSKRCSWNLEPGTYYLSVAPLSARRVQTLSIGYKILPQLGNDTIATAAPLTEKVWQDVWQDGYFSIGEHKAGEVVQIQRDEGENEPKNNIYVYDADGKSIASSDYASFSFRIPADGVYYLRIPEFDVPLNAENEPMRPIRIRYYTHNDEIGAADTITMLPNESVFLDLWFSPEIRNSLKVESEDEALTYDSKTGYLTAPNTPEGSADLVFSNGYPEGDERRIEAVVHVTWSEKLLSDISISNAPQSLTVGSSAMLEANVDADSYIKYVSWKSSDPSVLRVLSNGKVVAVGQGEAVITASIGEATSSVTITVTGEQPGESGLTGVSLDRYTLTLYAGEEAPCIASFPGMKERTVIVNSFSKSYAMTGWRIGFVAAPAEIVDRMTKCQENFNACANAPGQYAATVALDHPELCEELRQVFERRRSILLDGLSKIDGIRCNRPNGAFYVFADISSFGLSSVEFCNRLLDEQKVVCIPGSAFGECGEGFMRIAYTCSDENLHEALRRIDAFCKSL